MVQINSEKFKKTIRNNSSSRQSNKVQVIDQKGKGRGNTSNKGAQHEIQTMCTIPSMEQKCKEIQS